MQQSHESEADYDTDYAPMHVVDPAAAGAPLATEPPRSRVPRRALLAVMLVGLTIAFVPLSAGRAPALGTDVTAGSFIELAHKWIPDIPPTPPKLPDDRPASEVAYVVVMRHGEKVDKGHGLSEAGIARSEYLARCTTAAQPSTLLPFGPPTYVMASHDTPTTAHRARQTALPIAAALGMELNWGVHIDDFAKFVETVEEQLTPHGTVLAVWHHNFIPRVVNALMKQDGWTIEDLGWDIKWPPVCGSDSAVPGYDAGEGFEEPLHHQGTSICYDLSWRVTMTRASNKAPWVATALTSTLQGFEGGEKHGELQPCTKGLAPIV